MDKTLETTIMFDQAKTEEVKAYQKGKISYRFVEGQGFVAVPAPKKVLGWHGWLDSQKRQK